MAVICPTITAYDTHEYRAQIEAVQLFADRIHIDLMDGQFAPHTSVDLQHIWWPEQVTADIHLMYQWPMNYVDRLIMLKPSLVVIHAEAEVDLIAFADKLHAAGIKVGLAILQATTVETVASALAVYDHVLVFSGNLGEHGGTADLSLLQKVPQLLAINPKLEISWDGGISDQNAKQLVDGGIQVLNTGGFIQKSDNPSAAYQKLLDTL